MNIQRLKYFISVAELSSFTKAANNHYIAQTAISRYVANLEKEIGVPLFSRSTHDVKLTPAGRAFLPEAKKIVETYEEALQKVKYAHHEQAPMIFFGFGEYEQPLISKIAGLCRSCFPQAEFDIAQHSYFDLVRLLLSGQIDIVVATEQSLSNIHDLVYKPIYPNDSVAVVSKNNPICLKRSLTLSDLENLTLITQANENGPYNSTKIYQSFYLKYGVHPQAMKYVNSPGAKIAMAESSDGAALMPRLMAESLPPTLCSLELPPSTIKSTSFCVGYMRTNKKDLVHKLFDRIDYLYAVEYE